MQSRGEPRVLIVDCYLDDVGGARNIEPYFEGAEVLRAAHDALPESLEAEGIVISGSAASVLEPPAWASRLETLVSAAAERETPILGLCFGHQLLARAVFGERAVRSAVIPELGWTTVRRVGTDPLFAGLEDEFTTFVSHKDEVDASCPAFRENARILASNRACEVEAFRVEGRPLWGVQFHAEMQLGESSELVRSRMGRDSDEAKAELSRAIATPELVCALFRNFREELLG